MANLAKAFSSENIKQQAGALPQYLSQIFQGSPHDKNYLPKEGYGFAPGTNVQLPREERIPTPPLRMSTATPTATPTPQQTQVAGATSTERGRNPATKKVDVSNDVLNAIMQASAAYGVPSQLLFDVAMAESTFNPQGKNPKGSASGLFAFTDATWQDSQRLAKLPNTNRWDPYSNALAAAYWISNGYLDKWEASRDDPNNNNSWGQFWNNEELQNYYTRKLDRSAKEE